MRMASLGTRLAVAGCFTLGWAAATGWAGDLRTTPAKRESGNAATNPTTLVSELGAPAATPPSDVSSSIIVDPPRPWFSSAGSAHGWAPNLIGGHHGIPFSLYHEVHDDANFMTVQQSTITDLPLPWGRSYKVAENNSPEPRDRYYFMYNWFTDVFRTSTYETVSRSFRTKNFDVHRYTFGIEKTLPDDQWSIEFRIPFSSTLDPELTTDILNKRGANDIAFGNVSLTLKYVLYNTPSTLISGGLGVEAPTAPTAKLTLTDFLLVFNGATGVISENLIRFQSFELDNDAPNLTPFLAFLYTPSSGWFAQSFLQMSVPTDNSDLRYSERIDDLQQLQPGVTNNFGPTGNTLRLRNQTLVHWDLGLGYWLMRHPNGRWLTGIAPSLELNYTTALDEAEIALAIPDGFPVLRRGPDGRSAGTVEDVPFAGNLANRFDWWLITFGTTFEIRNNSTVALAFSIPLSDRHDRIPDFALQLQLNRRFGVTPREEVIASDVTAEAN